MKRRALLCAGGFLALTLLALTPVWGEEPNLKAASGAGTCPVPTGAQQSPQQGPTTNIVPHAALGLNTRLVAGYGELVAGVTQGGKAELMGLKTGDVIQAVNGVRTTTAGALSKSLISAAAENSLTLKIRDGRSGEVTYRARGK